MHRIILALVLALALPCLAKPDAAPVNQLAARLYARLAAEKKGQNLFFSPYSISMAVSMAAGGARGETRAQMLKVLGLKEPRSQTALAAALKSAFFKEGNRVWVDRSVEVKPEYLAFTAAFGAEATRVDFRGAAEAARKTINAWVSKQTADKIPELIPGGAVDGSTRMVLTNAIYFKADWRSRFAEKDTRPAPFRLIPTGQVQVPMMHLVRELPYGRDARVAVCELPYQGDFVMTIVLPHQPGDLASLEKGLDPAKYVALLGHPQRVDVALPRFKTRSSFELAEILAALGMPAAFGPADFSGISREPLFISRVIHEAVVEVNEKGTEAAAATAVVMTKEAAAANGPAIFHADHPFLFMISHRPTGTIAFMGRIMKP